MILILQGMGACEQLVNRFFLRRPPAADSPISPHFQALRTEIAEVSCAVEAGDALLMRPLLLHASSRSTRATHRRVLHLEYAWFPLPDGLAWHEAA
jgi:hypothetical protein